MVGDEEAGPPVVDPDKIIFRPHRTRSVAAVEQHNLNTCKVKRCHDAIVDSILCRGKLKRRKEDTRDFLLYVLMTEVLGLLLLLRGLPHGVSTEQRVRLG